MSKRSIFALLLCLCVGIVLCCACQGPTKPNPNHKFVSEEYVDPDDPFNKYDMLTVNDRDYVIYGIRGHGFFSDKSSVRATVGYKYDPDEPESKDMLVVTLNETDDYILLHSIENRSFMFYRALDTKGMDIETPDYIAPSELKLWN